MCLVFIFYFSKVVTGFESQTRTYKVTLLLSSLQLGSNRLVVLSGCECVGPYEDEAECSVHAQSAFTG